MCKSEYSKRCTTVQSNKTCKYRVKSILPEAQRSSALLNILYYYYLPTCWGQSCYTSQRFDCIVLGDFNTTCYMLKLPHNNICVNGLGSFERKFDMKQLKVSPTRVYTSSTNESNLDLIIVSDHHEKVCQSDFISIGLSDHKLTYCTHKVTKF